MMVGSNESPGKLGEIRFTLATSCAGNPAIIGLSP